MIGVSIVGGSGYAGGELLRLLLDHPHVQVVQVSSESNVGRYVYSVHPNLRGRTRLKFCQADQIAPCDVLFVALHHGETQRQIERLAALAPRIVDLSADFRLRDPVRYKRWYGEEHAAPQWIERFVYGLPELHRAEIRQAHYVSGVGCNATATILGLYPLFRANLVDRSRDIVVEVKVGSSEGGRRENPASHHPERSGAVRSFAPTGHRHTAEIVQELTLGGAAPAVHLTGTAIELVRGVLATGHAFLNDPAIRERDLWGVYRDAYGNEPFVRIVKERQGIYRYPEPKILAGSNYCDVGFALDEETGRVVAISAIDNLVKGAAGSAVQCMNLMCGIEETTGLTFAGLHPI
ncbi:MAG: N-acetyl-gamma-glutamyl-phosphate reductase [Anaerolineae bacterium]|nr:N-acetyl-gamma-glutamyl-phosphate reductase [Anaerolineae bacterium]